MGCDYYIIRELEITYANEQTLTKELRRIRGYIFRNEEEDSDDEYMEDYLTVTYEPRILFENGTWKDETIRKKYEPMVREYTPLVRVIKQERRCRRY
jgi:hypothetical protein